jgi:hypothetical protein
VLRIDLNSLEAYCDLVPGERNRIVVLDDRL